MKKFLILWAGILFSVFLPAEELKISVKCGFGNYQRVGYVHPVFVTIENTGNTLITAQISAHLARSQFSSYSSIYHQKTTLPYKSKKLITFYIQLNDRTSVWVKVNADNGEEYEVKKDLQLIDNSPFIKKNFVVTDGFNDSANKFHQDHWLHIGSKNLISDLRHLDSVIDSSYFPRDAIALQSVDIIAIAFPAKINFNTAQTRALLDWVAIGGCLIVADSSVAGQGFIQGLKKVNPNISLQLPKSGYHLNSYERGQILVFYDPPEAKLVRTILHNKQFFNKTLGFPRNIPSDYKKFHMKNKFDRVLVGKISIGWMVILFILYVLCVGPLDYWLCKKYNKRMLTWIIYPVCIIAFSTFAYLKSHWIKSGPMRSIEVNCLDVFPQANRARGYSFLGIYSTRNANYNISYEHSSWIFLGKELSWNSHNQDSIAPTNIFPKNGGSQVEVRIPVYSSKTYVTNWMQDISGFDISSIEISPSRYDLYLKVDLPSDLPIEKVIVGIMANNKHLEKYSLDKPTTSGEWHLRRLHSHNKNKYYKTLEYISTHYNIKKFSGPERNLNLHQKLHQGNYAVVFIILKKSLNSVQIGNDSPQRDGINVIRILVPIEE